MNTFPNNSVVYITGFFNHYQMIRFRFNMGGLLPTLPYRNYRYSRQCNLLLSLNLNQYHHQLNHLHLALDSVFVLKVVSACPPLGAISQPIACSHGSAVVRSLEITLLKAGVSLNTLQLHKRSFRSSRCRLNNAVNSSRHSATDFQQSTHLFSLVRIERYSITLHKTLPFSLCHTHQRQVLLLLLTSLSILFSSYPYPLATTPFVVIRYNYNLCKNLCW